MNIILGTAQFGKGYGIKNKYKVIEIEKVINILKHSNKRGIKFLDTASTYNFTNRIYKYFKLDNFEIINKISYNDTKNLQNLKNNLKKNLDKINKDNYYCIQLHQPYLYEKDELKKIYDFLLNLKSNKLVKKIGFSIYDPQEYKKYLNNFKPDIVQGPLNIFDRRVINYGLIDMLRKNGVEFHARSIFLQGLLLINKKSNYFLKWKKKFDLFEKLAEQNKVQKFEYAVNYIKQQKNINSVIFGVDNLSHLNSTLNAFNKPNIKISNKLIINDTSILNPSNWKI